MYAIQDIIDCINYKCLPEDTMKIYTMVPTKTGCHLITKPFNMQTFKEKYPTVDIHKDNPTILYCKK
jgi:hypothetical protein